MTLSNLVMKLGELAKRNHYTCEDTWYSCPKSGECCNDCAGEDCNCGADDHNKEVEALLIVILELTNNAE